MNLLRLHLAGAAVALAASFCGNALAATPVNIADPTTASRVARVEPGNRLAVQGVAPSTYLHSSSQPFASGSCVPLAVPPTGKALIVHQVRIDVAAVTSGPGDFVQLKVNCATLVGELHPPTTGPFTVTFDPGLAIDSNSTLGVAVTGNVQGQAFADAHTVSANVVPGTIQSLQVNQR